MYSKKIISILFVYILLPVAIFAQDKDETAKIRQKQFGILTGQIIADARNLKLGENRAVVYAKIGTTLWQTDKKLALELFHNAVGELVNAQMQAESKPKISGYQNELLTGQQTRPQILRIIAVRDAELALDFLYKTRPAAISKAFLYQSAKSNKIRESPENYAYLAQNEFSLEQNFVRLAADQNPERAVKLLKESIKKGFSYETVSLLNKLFEKDAQTAAEMASEVVSKLIQSRFMKDNQPISQNLEIAISLLSDFSRAKQPSEKTLKFDDAQMRNLADSLFSFYLEKAGKYNNLSTYAIIPLAEKLAPAKVTQLKNLRTVNRRSGGNFGLSSELSKVLSGELPAEQMIAEAVKFPVSVRGQIYQSAANKFAAAGNFPAAAEVLNNNFEDSALDQAMNNLNWSFIYQLINEGKFAEAENLIDTFPETSRFNSLIVLANAVYQKNPSENKPNAVRLLGKARSLVSEKPENSQELSNLMQIVQTFAQIEVPEAFNLYEPLVPRMNELADASAVINSFQGGGNVREGEFLLVNSDSYGFYGADFSVFQIFAKNDFNRTINLINLFSRSEIRINLKLKIAESLLN